VVSEQVTLQPATQADAPRLALLHDMVWQKTYYGLAPRDVRSRLNGAHRLQNWKQALAAGVPCTLAMVENKLAGFISYGPANNPVFGDSAEIKHLYISQARQRQGLGRKLFTHALEQLQEAGYDHASLAVVQGNTPALGFYADMGGEMAGGFQDAGPIWKSHNLILSWDLAEISAEDTD